MNTRIRVARLRSITSFFGRVLLLGGSLLLARFGAAAADQPAPGPGRASADTNALATASPVQGILRMLEAGVSKEVVKAYIENSPPYTPSIDEIIALKQRAVPDEITTALLKRKGESTRQTNSSGENPPASPADSNHHEAGLPYYSRLDPEGYDFWWYHYAYPRTLSYAYERLYHPYPYGFYRPAPFSYPPFR